MKSAGDELDTCYPRGRGVLAKFRNEGERILSYPFPKLK
jgi:hypothetical protein